ncbi:MAG: LytR family transcriptional regulator, partial [Clostridiales bacterium]|nr:LytR family transcriptional regulator [Clostridiales bacterium]
MNRPENGNRPVRRASDRRYVDRRPGQARRPQPRRRRRPQARFYVLIALVVLIIAAAVALVVALNSRKTPDVPAETNVQATAAAPSAQQDVQEPGVSDAALDVVTNPPSARAAQLAAMLGDEGNVLETLSSSEQAVVTDLSLNEDLPDDWLNVLLLGSDERVDGANARTDSMIICSINTTTGEVKLTSILRDVAVDFTDLGDLNGTYRINAANYFGGEALAMKTVNECFGLNIENYVRVNIFGFQ